MFNQQIPINHVSPDIPDDAIIDDVFGVAVTFTWSGCPGVYPRQQLKGVVLDVKTCKNGERYLLVKADALNLPKWINLNDVQFPVSEKAVA